MLGRMHHGGPMAQRYKKRGVNDIGNSNNSITLIEEELITEDLNQRGMASRYIPAKQLPRLVKYLISAIATPWRRSSNPKSREHALSWRNTPNPNKSLPS